MKKIIILFVGLILLIPFSSFATPYYVADSDGNDSYNGLYDHYISGSDGPWKTIQHAADTVSGAGGICYIRTGTYTQTDSLCWDTNSGSSPDYITFENYSGESPVIAGYNTSYPVIVDVNWVKFKGLIFDFNSGSNNENGIYVTNSWNSTDTHDLYFEDCEFREVGGNGYGNIQITATSGYNTYNITLHGCTSHDNNATDNGGEGIYITNHNSSSDIHDVTVEECTVYNCPEGIQVGPGEGGDIYNILITKNEISSCGTGIGGYGGGMSISPGTSGNVVIEYNKIHDNTGTYCYIGGIELKNGSDTVIRYNLFYDIAGTNGNDAGIFVDDSNVTGGSIYGNTIFNMHGSGGNGIAVLNGSTITNCYNNIIRTVTGYQIFEESGSTITNCGNNLRSGGSADKTCSNDVTSDPLFVSEVNGSENLSLQENSPAIDVGYIVGTSGNEDDALDANSSWPSSVTTLDQDLYGLGWEIGAYVYEEQAASGVEVFQGSIQGSVP